MSVRISKDKNVRKISRIGNRSLGITLPVEMLRDLNWKEKQKVIVRKVPGGVLIKDWRSPAKPKAKLGKK